MLENNSNRLMFAAIAVVIGGGIYGTVNAAYPDAINQIIKKIQYPIDAQPKFDFRQFDNINGGNVSTSPYTFNGIKDGQWNGVFSPIQINDKIPPGYWREISIGIKPEQDSTVQVDVNNYDLDNPNWDRRNDNDEWGERNFKLYENGKLVGSLGWGKTPVLMQAGHSYKLKLKYHNTSKYTLYDTMNKETDWLKNGISDIMFGTTDGSAGNYNVFDSEYATYKLPANI